MEEINEQDTSDMAQELMFLIEKWANEEKNPYAIGAVLMTTSMRLYRTALSDDEYNLMIDFMSNSRDKIQKYVVEVDRKSLVELDREQSTQETWLAKD